MHYNVLGFIDHWIFFKVSMQLVNTFKSNAAMTAKRGMWHIFRNHIIPAPRTVQLILTDMRLYFLKLTTGELTPESG